VTTESLGLDRDARQAEIWAKSKADIFSVPLFFASLVLVFTSRLCHQYHCHQDIYRTNYASLPSQWVHARGQPHWVRCLGLSRGQGGSGGLGSLFLILLCLSLAVCSVPCRFSAANGSLHPPLSSFSQVLQIWQVYRGEMS